MKKQAAIVQDIDQPVFGETNKTPRWFRWLALGVAVVVMLGIFLSLLLSKGGQPERRLEEQAFPISEPLSPTPKTVASPAGALRVKWQEIKKQLDSLDPQQNAFQPPELDFDIGI